jgi:hypothetical protein
MRSSGERKPVVQPVSFAEIAVLTDAHQRNGSLAVAQDFAV